MRLSGVATRDAVYAKFGEVAEAAQLFETDLGTILLALEGKSRDWHLSPDPKAATVFYEKLNKKTLGQILAAVSKYVPLDEGVAAAFERGLDARNRLNHGFFERHSHALHDPGMRALMLVDLFDLHGPISEAGRIAGELASTFTNQLLKASSTKRPPP